MRPDGRELAAIFVGGFIGAVARAEVVVAFPTHAGDWPWPTFVINLAGAFALGYVATRLQERLPLSSYRRPFLGTGICGALTTFSTMQVEILQMLDGGPVASMVEPTRTPSTTAASGWQAPASSAPTRRSARSRSLSSTRSGASRSASSPFSSRRTSSVAPR